MNKGIIVLFFIVISLAGLTFFIDEKEQVAEEAKLFLPELEKNINDITSIDIRVADGENITVYKDEDRWKLKQKSNYVVDFSQVRKLLIELSELTILAKKTKKMENYAKLGVEDVSSTGATSKQVTIYGKDGVELAAIIVGNQKNLGLGKSTLFVRLIDSPQVWQLEGGVTLASHALGWLDKKITDIAKEKIISVEIAHVDGGNIHITRGENEINFSLLDLADNQTLATGKSLDSIANALSGLQFIDVMNKADFELDSSAVVAAKYSLVSGEILTVSSVEKDDKLMLWFDIASNEDTRNREFSENLLTNLPQDLEAWVFEIPKHKSENFRMTWAALVQDKTVE